MNSKTPESRDRDSGVFFYCMCHALTQVAVHGIASPPDTRIMIPNSDCSNPYIDKEKRQEGKSVYTPVYTSESELKYVMHSWNYLSSEVREIILKLIEWELLQND